MRKQIAEGFMSLCGIGLFSLIFLGAYNVMLSTDIANTKRPRLYALLATFGMFAFMCMFAWSVLVIAGSYDHVG